MVLPLVFHACAACVILVVVVVVVVVFTFAVLFFMSKEKVGRSTTPSNAIDNDKMGNVITTTAQETNENKTNAVRILAFSAFMKYKNIVCAFGMFC